MRPVRWTLPLSLLASALLAGCGVFGNGDGYVGDPVAPSLGASLPALTVCKSTDESYRLTVFGNASGPNFLLSFFSDVSSLGFSDTGQREVFETSVVFSSPSLTLTVQRTADAQGKFPALLTLASAIDGRSDLDLRCSAQGAP
jgi:hypothetical protein